MLTYRIVCFSHRLLKITAETLFQHKHKLSYLQVTRRPASKVLHTFINTCFCVHTVLLGPLHASSVLLYALDLVSVRTDLFHTCVVFSLVAAYVTLLDKKCRYNLDFNWYNHNFETMRFHKKWLAGSRKTDQHLNGCGEYGTTAL